MRKTRRLSRRMKKEQLVKVSSIIYLVLISLMLASFTIFMVLLKPLVSHPYLPRGIGTTIYLLMILLVVITVLSTMTVFILLKRRTWSNVF